MRVPFGHSSFRCVNGQISKSLSAMPLWNSCFKRQISKSILDWISECTYWRTMFRVRNKQLHLTLSFGPSCSTFDEIRIRAVYIHSPRHLAWYTHPIMYAHSYKTRPHAVRSCCELWALYGSSARMPVYLISPERERKGRRHPVTVALDDVEVG